MCHSADHDVQAEALFVSDVQASDQLGAPAIRAVVATALDRYGPDGCAARVAYECGEHPEPAARRMTWARRAVEDAFDTPAARSA